MCLSLVSFLALSCLSSDLRFLSASFGIFEFLFLDYLSDKRLKNSLAFGFFNNTHDKKITTGPNQLMIDDIIKAGLASDVSSQHEYDTSFNLMSFLYCILYITLDSNVIYGIK